MKTASFAVQRLVDGLAFEPERGLRLARRRRDVEDAVRPRLEAQVFVALRHALLDRLAHADHHRARERHPLLAELARTGGAAPAAFEPGERGERTRRPAWPRRQRPRGSVSVPARRRSAAAAAVIARATAMRGRRFIACIRIDGPPRHAASLRPGERQVEKEVLRLQLQPSGRHPWPSRDRRDDRRWRGACRRDART